MDKQWYKDRIYGYEVRAVSLITTAFLNGTPKKVTVRYLRNLLNSFANSISLSRTEYVALWNWTISTYTRMSKQTWGKKNEQTVQQVAAKQYRAMEREKNQIADSIEFRYKHDRAMSYIKSNTVFYQLSTHTNCAEGHLPFQGKVFINEDVASDEEKEYAQKHNIPSIRDMMFNEPWLTTRTNCKHFFIPLSTSEVLTDNIPDQPVVHDKELNTPYRAYYVPFMCARIPRF